MRAIQEPGAAARDVAGIFVFRRPKHKPRGKPSNVLALSEKQHDVM